jgi:hypothetical protein
LKGFNADGVGAEPSLHGVSSVGMDHRQGRP